jgi:hypothetical protein
MDISNYQIDDFFNEMVNKDGSIQDASKMSCDLSI